MSSQWKREDREFNIKGPISPKAVETTTGELASLAASNEGQEANRSPSLISCLFMDCNLLSSFCHSIEDVVGKKRDNPRRKENYNTFVRFPAFFLPAKL
jgi:hypothetical protein